jgi:hypothetical protein
LFLSNILHTFSVFCLSFCSALYYSLFTFSPFHYFLLPN